MADNALDKVDQSLWDTLKVFDRNREALESADKTATAFANNIEQAVWADVDTGMA